MKNTKNTKNTKNYKVFIVFEDTIQLDIDNKVMIINNKPITFKRLDEINKETRHVNRIHKPTALLIFIDYKNNNLSKWKEFQVI